MTKIRMESIVEQLSAQVRQALADAVTKTIPDASFDQYQLFREFKQAIGRRCATWETIPNECVRQQGQ
jgi:hypothetical protein